MRRAILILALVAAAVVLVWTQHVWAQQTKAPAPYVYPPYEVKLLFPREVTPAHYEQVAQQDVQSLALQGWELVSVMPYVYRNEERGNEPNNRPAVTQTYPAYFFKRLRAPNAITSADVRR
jgi:hypothetical protein